VPAEAVFIGPSARKAAPTAADLGRRPRSSGPGGVAVLSFSPAFPVLPRMTRKLHAPDRVS